MSDNHKKQLETQLWNIANTLRGKMNADEFRDYVLGYFLKPSKLYHPIASRENGHEKNAFILDDLARILNNTEQSIMGPTVVHQLELIPN